jgi:hypothetical protein
MTILRIPQYITHRAPRPRRRKYPPPKGELSEPDRRELARLVGKYGRDIIRARANDVPLRGPGRPAEGTGPLRKAVDLVFCFEDLVDQHRKAGSRKPIADAEHELFEFEFSKEQQRQPGLFQRWQKNIRKKRLRGQRELQRRRAAARARALSFQRPKKGRK